MSRARVYCGGRTRANAARGMRRVAHAVATRRPAGYLTGMALDDVARTWGSTAAERTLPYPCDPHLPDADDSWFRAIDVAAPPAVVFRWLCQLRAAPYSYDWIDNRGRTSPRTLTPGLDALAIGQRVMGVFDLVAFERDRHVTIVLRHGTGLLGSFAVTYLVVPRDPAESRIVVKLLVRHPRTHAAVVRVLGPWLDLIMMRKQLLTLKALAEATPSA
jgi:hypothetical protein